MHETSTEMPPWHASAARMARGDPLLQRITRAKLSPILLGVVYAVVVMSMRVLAAWRAGHLRTVGPTTGVLDDPTLWTNLVFAAVIVGYYSWIPRGISAVFDRLCENEVIGAPVARKDDGEEHRGYANYAAFVEAVESSLGRRLWPALALVATLVSLLIIAPGYWARREIAGFTADPVSLVLALIWVAVGIYCVGVVLAYGLLTTYWLRRLFDGFKMNVRPLHPDRAGGLAPIGSFTLRLSYLIALVGIILVATSVTRNYVDQGTLQFYWTTDILVAMAVYAVAAPAVFFLPLGTAHRSMSQAKARLLLQISRRFQAEYHHVWRSLDDHVAGPEGLEQAPVRLKDSLEILDDLQALHETTSRFPVWPFNASNLARFGTSFLSPFLLALLTNLLSVLLMA
jgi:hypothetical protein